MEINNEILGKKIKEYRRRLKISQSQLAELVDLSDKHIGRIESGKYSPSIRNFLKIIEVLKIDISDFGFNSYMDNSNLEKKKLIELINLSSVDEISLYLDIIQLLKNHKN